jgi:heat shock protein HslJ
MPSGPPLTVIFEQTTRRQGTVSGWGSCNSYSALYEQRGSLLSIESSTVGDKVCATEAEDQERALLDALQAATSYSLSGGQLVLRNSRGEVVLNLVASQASAP